MLTLSKNLTFSLAIVTMFVLGFAFAPVALAHTGVTHTALKAGEVSTAAAPGTHGDGVNQHQHVDGAPAPEPDLSVTDVSEADGNQLELYAAIDRTNVTTNNLATQSDIDTEIITETALVPPRDVEFYIRLKNGYALLDPTVAAPSYADDAAAADMARWPMLHRSDLSIGFYDIDGAAVVQEDGINEDGSVITHRNTAFRMVGTLR